ncbi:YciI family protein [Sphingomonas sp. ASV193]|uniref:YciI family protein n=1 Tax=Sphingomonas sp. ASV193 TaxID=3144405 RepID=UPI0032E8B042
MKYALLIYQPYPFEPKSLPKGEFDRIASEYQAVSLTPNITSGPPLGHIKDAMTVKLVDGQPLSTPGPFVDEAGAVGGFLLFEANDMEDAVALAARIPAVRLGGAVEVRPCEVYW